MAQIVWTEPALNDLDAIADYIALDNPEAAKILVQRVFRHVELLADYPKSGSKPPEVKSWRYRQSIEAPCRVFYRQERTRVYIIYVMRGERLLRSGVLIKRNRRLREKA